MHINELTIDQLKSAYMQSLDSEAFLGFMGRKAQAKKFAAQKKAIMQRIEELEPVKPMSEDELLAELMA